MSRDPMSESDRDAQTAKSNEIRDENAELTKDVKLLEEKRTLERENRKLIDRLDKLESDDAAVIAAEDERARLLAEGHTLDDDG